MPIYRLPFLLDNRKQNRVQIAGHGTAAVEKVETWLSFGRPLNAPALTQI
jgi:hypothetical protein